MKGPADLPSGSDAGGGVCGLGTCRRLFVGKNTMTIMMTIIIKKSKEMLYSLLTIIPQFSSNRAFFLHSRIIYLRTQIASPTPAPLYEAPSRRGRARSSRHNS